MPWKNPWYDPRLSHTLPGGFCNPEPDVQQPGSLGRWRRERKVQALPKAPAGGYDAFIARWWQLADITGEEDGVWWLGHATLLLRKSGRYILTDPVFSERASPLRFYGPRRKTPPALALIQLPSLDAVLISHNHYDHLDLASIRLICRGFPEVRFFVPAGLGTWFRYHGIRYVTELDWWESQRMGEFHFTAVPARHWSMRTFWDRNRSLWCGWVIEHQHLRFWFSGDSGYSGILHAIPERLGPINAAALPIGAYEPRWFMSAHHMAPDEAVTLWHHIGRPLTIPIHWGVFELADESLDQPPQALLAALREVGEDEVLFQPRRIGQFMPLPSHDE